MRELSDWRVGLRDEIEQLMAEGFQPPPAIHASNPLSVRFTPDIVWRGQIGHDPDGRCRFLDASYGIRAASIIIIGYCWHHKRVTTRNLISAWSSEPPIILDSYITYVAGVLGIDPDASLDIHIQGRIGIRAMIGFECASQWKHRRIAEYYQPDFIRDAVHASHQI